MVLFEDNFRAFFYLIDDFSMKIRGVLTLSLMETRKYPCTFKRHFDFRNSKDLKSNVVLKQKYTLYSIVCLDNVKYRSTLGRNGGGWGYFKQVCGKNKKVLGYFLQQEGGWWGVCLENSPFSEISPKIGWCIFKKYPPPPVSVASFDDNTDQ